jgi:hypothetical protein
MKKTKNIVFRRASRVIGCHAVALLFTLALASGCEPTLIGFGTAGGSSGQPSPVNLLMNAPWTIEEGAAGGTTVGKAIAVDNSGNLYVTGSTTESVDGQTLYGNTDLFITKYSPAGNRLWTVEDGAPGGTTIGYAIATDSANNVYVTGEASQPMDGQSQNGTFLSKYSSDGDLEWTVLNGNYRSGWSGGRVAVGPSGNIDVIGPATYVINASAHESIYLAQYNSSGVQQWIIVPQTVNPTKAGGIALDSSENIYFTTLNTSNAIIEKYSSSGDYSWSVSDAASGTTIGNGIASDSSGNTYVVGATFGALDGQELQGSEDLFLTKYDSSGIRQWTIEDGTSGGSTSALGVALDSQENPFLTGFTTEGLDGQTLQGTQDLFISKYNENGTLQWTKVKKTARSELR